MSLARLEEREGALFALFHPMPNDNERSRLFKQWMAARSEINKLEYTLFDKEIAYEKRSIGSIARKMGEGQ